MISEVFSLIYYQKGMEADLKIGSSVLPNCKILFAYPLTLNLVSSLNALEPSTDKSVVFCGGTTEKNQQGLTSAIISVITFD